MRVWILKIIIYDSNCICLTMERTADAGAGCGSVDLRKKQATGHSVKCRPSLFPCPISTANPSGSATAGWPTETRTPSKWAPSGFVVSRLFCVSGVCPIARQPPLPGLQEGQHTGPALCMPWLVVVHHCCCNPACTGIMIGISLLPWHVTPAGVGVSVSSTSPTPGKRQLSPGVLAWVISPAPYSHPGLVASESYHRPSRGFW